MPVNDIMLGVLSIYFGKDYELPTFKADADEKLRKEIVEKSGQTAEWFSSKYIHIKPDEKVRFENYIRASHVFAK